MATSYLLPFRSSSPRRRPTSRTPWPAELRAEVVTRQSLFRTRCVFLSSSTSLSHDMKISHGHAFFDWELRWCRFLTFLTGSRLCEDGCALFRLWTGRQQPWRGPGLPFSSASVRFSWSGELRRGYASASSWSRNARTYLPAVAGQQGRRCILTYSMATS